MNVHSLHLPRAMFYALTLLYHSILFLTNFGNFYHGGTVIELVALEAIAITTIFCAIKLIAKVSVKEKILVGFLTTLPLVSIVWTIVSAVTDRF